MVTSEGINILEANLCTFIPLPHNTAFWCIEDNYIDVENTVRKEEIACNKQFLLFSWCCLPYMVLIFHFRCTLKCCLQLVSIWTSLKFCRLGNGLILYQTNFKPFQIHSVCRRQNKCDQKIKICLGKRRRKLCWKRRKCWLPAFFFLFPQYF